MEFIVAVCLLSAANVKSVSYRDLLSVITKRLAINYHSHSSLKKNLCSYKVFEDKEGKRNIRTTPRTVEAIKCVLFFGQKKVSGISHVFVRSSK